MIKKQKGITLIALIITVIILLILAGITITQLMKNGLLDKAESSREISIKAQLKEEIEIFINELEIKSMLSGSNLDMKTISEELIDNLGNTEIDSVDTTIIGIYKEYEFTITEDHKVIIGNKVSGEKPIITHTVDTEVLGVSQVTITVNASVSDGTIVEIVKPDGNIEENTDNLTYTVNKSGKYVFIAKSSNGRKSKYIVEIKNIRPSEPIIETQGAYPIITSSGIQNPQGEVTIIYDDNDKLLNTYSEDNGVTFKEYIGPFKPNSSIIIAKSEYRENSEVSIQSQKSVIPADAIGPEYYDGSDEWNGFQFDSKYINVDDSVIGKKLFFNTSYYASRVDGRGTVNAIDEDNQIIDSIRFETSFEYTIIEGTKRLNIMTWNDGVHYTTVNEISLINEPEIICEDEYPIIKNNKFITDVQVEIKYFDTSVDKKYKIDDGEWKNYIEPITLKYGETIYAVGYDKDGKQTRKITQYTNNLASDALPIQAYDGDESTYIGTYDYRHIKIDSSMIGKILIFKIGSYKGAVTIKAVDKNNEVISSIVAGSPIEYEIPQNTTKLSIYTCNGDFDTGIVSEIYIK